MVLVKNNHRRIRASVLIAAVLVAALGSSLAPSTAIAATKSAELPAPSVVSVTATPRVLSFGGGRVAVTAPVKHAATCQLEVVAQGGLSLVYSHGPSTGCHGGNFVAHITVGPNSSPGEKTVTFKLVARNTTSTSSRTFRISDSGRPVPTTTTSTTAPPTTTTTTVPAATTTTSVPLPTGLAPLPSSISTTGSNSYNWAGYTIAGGPFTAIEGTFTVPAPTASATCSEVMYETVGLDEGSGSDLIDAGINISQFNPSTGNCVSGTNYFVPYWATNTNSDVITNVVVKAGDTVKVEIWKVTATSWAISLTDITNGETDTTVQSYSGPGSSAEWLLQTPIDKTLCGTGEDPSEAGVCQVQPFLSNIQFASLALAGTVGPVTEVAMQQDEGTVTPSAITNSSFSDSFS